MRESFGRDRWPQTPNRRDEQKTARPVLLTLSSPEKRDLNLAQDSEVLYRPLCGQWPEELLRWGGQISGRRGRVKYDLILSYLPEPSRSEFS
jgi:hypothetical protein